MTRTLISLLLLTTLVGVTCSLTPHALIRSKRSPHHVSSLHPKSSLSLHTKQTHAMSFHIMDENTTTLLPPATMPPNPNATDAPTTASPTDGSTTTSAPTTVAPTTQTPTTQSPTSETPTTQAPTTPVPIDNTTVAPPSGSLYQYNPSPLVTTTVIPSGSVYNDAGNKLYYPTEFSMLEDFREVRSSVILEMVETGWNNNTLVVLENTLSDDPQQAGYYNQYIRLYVVFRNGTRQEILEDYWSLTSHPWYLGQTIGFNHDVSPTKVVLTFEGRVQGEDPNQFMYLGFYILDLNVSYDQMIPTSSNQTVITLVTPFQIVQKQEPTYFESGTVYNGTRTIHQIDTLVVSQTQGILNYQLKPVGAVNDGENNWPAGYLLLMRFRYFGGIRLIRYTDDIQPIYQTLLVPEIIDPHLPQDYYELTPTVGYVQVDPDGHIYVLIDIGEHEVATVTHYHRALLGTRTKQSSILFLLDHTGTIVRADWVPISYPTLNGQLTTSITIKEGDGHVGITHIGLTQTNQVASIIEYLSYNITSSYIPTPQSSAAMILTLPPMIRNDCVIPTDQVAVYAVTALSTRGDYAIAGAHGYVQAWDNNGYPYTTYPGTSFVAILKLDRLLTNGYTNVYVNNFGVRNRDNIATNLIATPDGGVFVGTQLDRYLPSIEKNDSMKYERTAIFHVGRSSRVCDPATTQAGWVTCGVEMCLSWCTALTPQAIDVNVNIVPDAQCNVKNNVPPVQLPSVGNDNGGGNPPASGSSSNSRAIGLGVGLGLGLGGICLLLFCYVCYRQKQGTTTRHTPVPMEGIGERNIDSNVVHQQLHNEDETEEGRIPTPSAGITDRI